MQRNITAGLILTASLISVASAQVEYSPSQMAMPHKTGITSARRAFRGVSGARSCSMQVRTDLEHIPWQ